MVNKSPSAAFKGSGTGFLQYKRTEVYHMKKLVLVRHGESEWNNLNLFTGWADVDLSEKGHEGKGGRKAFKGRGLRL